MCRPSKRHRQPIGKLHGHLVSILGAADFKAADRATTEIRPSRNATYGLPVSRSQSQPS